MLKKRKGAQQTLHSFEGFARKKNIIERSLFDDIPSCVLKYSIFSRLSFAELSKVQGVSKKWKELTSPRSFLPFFLSYQRLKCGCQPFVPRPVFPTSFNSLIVFDPEQVFSFDGLPALVTFGCVDYVFELGRFSCWVRLILSLFMCENPVRLHLLLSPFSHGARLELICFILCCNIITPSCFGRCSHRNIYLFENFLNSLMNEPSIAAESLKIRSYIDNGFFPRFKRCFPSKPLTTEQRSLVETCPSSGSVVLAACFAGCGKTSTLVEYALARPSMRILYLCFNKSVQLHASNLFPRSNVCCKTLHSLAWESTGSLYRHKLQSNLRCNDVMRVMSVSAVLASAARNALLNFLCSCDDQIQPRHLNCVCDGELSAEHVCRLASDIWGKMCDIQDLSLPMLHSGYLKLYASRHPKIDFDLIMVDEAQDCDPVTMQVLSPANPQHCAYEPELCMQVISYQKVPKILVGDSHQQIYQFRGAVDAMKLVDASNSVRLSRTFRFGTKPIYACLSVRWIR
jgi:hypothetical protein